MRKKVAEEEIVLIVENFVESSEYDMVDMNIDPHRRLLRVVIDKKGGVDLANCAGMTKKISGLLERKDILRDHTIEISSPGVERMLNSDRDLDRNEGRFVKAHMEEEAGFTGTVSGYLSGFDSSTIMLDTEAGVQKLPRGKITKITGDVDFRGRKDRQRK